MIIKGVIFDLDGVIVSTDSLHYLAWKKIADKEGIYFDEEINHRLRGVSRIESLNILLEKANRVYTEEEKMRLADEKNNYYIELLKNLTPNDVLPGIIKVLKVLKEKGIKIAIGSSSKNAKVILERIGLLNSFDAISDGNDITRSKPFPDVFLVTAQKLWLKPEHCLVVEDAVAGIKAAKAAGMFAAAIGDAKKSVEADFILDSIEDLLRYV
ncbi:beta-phosphoglucomutase [Caldicellulosiruptor hydrothermalis 108]|uniref:Beta-phosphoglucomutase n=1 Tax=Caldicellulosiruptor hydrothermalis (strain DSM 18901 / VKM B-2411 / 108) TaxID=632292 RepID=E4Q8R7_CALH1|nr:beta-phosphoglucomutase [Caldicellulosiruptor hydrothermalis]ADQ08041.1 beta-phosphoglucomutase [Caldicellulosiruptor hydrothermalis 108]